MTMISRIHEGLSNAFYPLTNEFLGKAYSKMDLDVQKYCALARKVSQAIYHLPLSKDFKASAGTVFESSTRILAHLKLVDILEENQLSSSEEAKQYILWVQEAAKKCLQTLALELAKSRPLANIYLKEPVRIEIDVKGGWSEAVDVSSPEEVNQIKDIIYQHPFTLYFENEVDVRGYMAEAGVKLVTDKQQGLYQSFVKNSYISDPHTNLDLYPCQNPHGKVFSSFMEERDINVLKREVVQAELTKVGIESLPSSSAKATDTDKVRTIVASITSDEAKATQEAVEKKLKLTIKKVVDTEKVIYLKYQGSQLVHVQDHYPLTLIGKEKLAEEPITALRNKVYQAVKEDGSAIAPPIRYPRMTYYAKPQDQFNLINAECAVEYMEGKHPLLQQLSKLLKIGIDRHIRAFNEQQKQAQENDELKTIIATQIS